MKKAVFKVGVDDDKAKNKVLKTIARLAGVDSISMDMKEKKLTVTGDIDPVSIVSKLRKLCHTEIVSVGPAKEPEKKDDEKKKKDDDEEKKKELSYDAYNPNLARHVYGAEEKPTANFCVIC